MLWEFGGGWVTWSGTGNVGLRCTAFSLGDVEVVNVALQALRKL